MEYVHLAHIFVFAAFLLYIGIVQSKMPAMLYPVILAFGVIVILYHAYKSFFVKDAWINYIHIFIVGPLLVFIGLYQKGTPTKMFELVLMVAFAAIGYHGYHLLNGFNNKS
jgi:hypothetical protein